MNDWKIKIQNPVFTLAIFAGVSRHASARVLVDKVIAHSTVQARLGRALVDVN